MGKGDGMDSNTPRGSPMILSKINVYTDRQVTHNKHGPTLIQMSDYGTTVGTLIFNLRLFVSNARSNSLEILDD